MEHFPSAQPSPLLRHNELRGILLILLGLPFQLREGLQPAHRALEGRKTTGKVLLIP